MPLMDKRIRMLNELIRRLATRGVKVILGVNGVKALVWMRNKSRRLDCG